MNSSIKLIAMTGIGAALLAGVVGQVSANEPYSTPPPPPPSHDIFTDPSGGQSESSKQKMKTIKDDGLQLGPDEKADREKRAKEGLPAPTIGTK